MFTHQPRPKGSGNRQGLALDPSWLESRGSFTSLSGFITAYVALAFPLTIKGNSPIVPSHKISSIKVL